MTETILQNIFRFPVKGFLGQELSKTNLKAGAGIPNDRRYAITKGTQDTGKWMPSRNFYINARVDGMSKFKCDFDGETIHLKNILGDEINFELNNQSSIKLANEKIKKFMHPVGVDDDLPEPKIIDRGESSLWDYSDTPISIINVESVKALDDKLGTNLDPVRFRGNLIISGLQAWEEFSWMGKRIQVGDTILDVHRPIDRCPTPGVNPATGERDVDVTSSLRDHFGHIFCGMYANVVTGGEIKPGDTIKVIGDADIKLEDTLVINASNYSLWPRMMVVTSCDMLDKSTTIALKNIGSWPLPQAQKGQRLKLHLGNKGWTNAYILSASNHEYKIIVEDRQTDDPVTKHLLDGLPIGQHIVISGPYGRG